MASKYFNIVNQTSGNLVYDASYNLYIANNAIGEIQIVPVNTTTPSTFVTLTGVFDIVLSNRGTPCLYAITTVDQNLYHIDIATQTITMLFNGLYINSTVPAFFTIDSQNNFYYGRSVTVTDTTISKLLYFTDPTDPSTQDVFATIPGLQRLSGLTFDSYNYLYVGDYTNGTVSKIDSIGTVVSPFISGFINPQTIQYNGGILYITDISAGSVTLYTLNGVLIPSPFINGSLSPGLIGGTFNQSDNYTFSSTTTNSVYSVSSFENPYYRFIEGYSGQLLNDASANLYVIPSAITVSNTIVKISPEGLTTNIYVNTAGPPEPQVKIASAAIDSAGQTIYVMAAPELGSGGYLFQINTQTDVVTQDISGLSADSNSYISTHPVSEDIYYTYPNDPLNGGTSVYTLQGLATETRIVTFTSGLTTPGPIAVDPSGNIFIANTTELLISDPTGGIQPPLTGFTSISSLSFIAPDTLYIVDQATNTTGSISVFNRISQYPFVRPYIVNFFYGGTGLIGIAPITDNTIYFASSTTNSIYIMPNGVIRSVPYYLFGGGDGGSLVCDFSNNIYVSQNGVSPGIQKLDIYGNLTIITDLINIKDIALNPNKTQLYAISLSNSTLYQIDLTTNTVETLFTDISNNSGDTYMTTDSGGDVYYTADNNGISYIYKITLSGTPSQTLFSTLPTISFPAGIQFDSAGNLYVCDVYNGLIVKLNSSGSIVNNPYLSGLSIPVSIAFDSSQNLYVTCYNQDISGSINVFDSAGMPIAKPYITGIGNDYDLVGATFDSNGKFYFSSSNSGNIYRTVDEPPTPPPIIPYFQFAPIYGDQVLCNNVNNVYASNYRDTSNTIVKIDPSGTITPIFSSRFGTPLQMALDPSKTLIYIIIGEQTSLSILNTATDITNAVFTSLHPCTNVSMTADPSNTIYYIDSSSSPSVIYKITNPTGSPSQSLFTTLGSYGTSGMATDASGLLYICDTSNGSILQMDQSGTILQNPFISGFTDPNSIAFDSSGNLYVTSIGSASRISLYTSNGTVIYNPYILGTKTPYLSGGSLDASNNLYYSSFTNQAIYKTGYSNPHPYYLFSSAAFAATSILAGADTNLYVTTGAPEQFISIIDPSGFGLPYVSIPGLAYSTFDLSKRYLYSISSTNSNLYKTDTVTRTTTTPFISIHYPSYPITTSPSGDLYYVDNIGNIYTIALPGYSQSLFTTLPTNTGTDGLAFDSSSNLYVSDYVNNQILQIDPSGIPQVFSTGIMDPRALVIDSSQNLWVTTYNNTVIVLSPTGIPLSNPYIQVSGDDLYGLGFNSIGQFFFSTDNSIYTNQPAYIPPTPPTPPSPPPRYIFSTVEAYNLIIDPTNNLYTFDQTNSQIIKISPSGTVTPVISTPEFTSSILTFNPSYSGIYQIISGDPTLYLIDLATDTSSVLFTGLNNTIIPHTAVDLSGNFYYIDCSANPQIGQSALIYKITDPEGESPTQSLYATMVGIPKITGIAFDASGYLYVCDNNGGRIIQIDPNGITERFPFISGVGSNLQSITFKSNGDLWITNDTIIATYSSTGAPIYNPYIESSETIGGWGGVFDSAGQFYWPTGVGIYKTGVAPNPGPIICFKEGSLILCSIDDEEQYIPIEHIQRGTLVRTALNGYKRVALIGHSNLFNSGDSFHSINRLYICKKEAYPELNEDLVVTGAHSILIDELTEEQREKTLFYANKILVTDNKYRLMACLDERAQPYQNEGIYTIWHLALEHDDPLMNYGIYANGLLVETASKRMMQELSGMKLL